MGTKCQKGTRTLTDHTTPFVALEFIGKARASPVFLDRLHLLRTVQGKVSGLFFTGMNANTNLIYGGTDHMSPRPIEPISAIMCSIILFAYTNKDMIYIFVINSRP